MKVTYEIERRIEQIIESNIINYPYEGIEINKGNMKLEIVDLIKSLNG